MLAWGIYFGTISFKTVFQLLYLPLLQVIGKNRVAVPTHLFKIILVEGKRGSDDDSPTSRGPPAMGVFVIPNKKVGDVDLTRFQVSLEKLEAYTGTTFYSKLDRGKVGERFIEPRLV